MDARDHKKDLKHLYAPSAKEIAVVTVPPMRFLMVDGQGDPNTAPAYARALEMLFAVSYTVKFMVKKEAGVDYRVMPLEGLWWAADMADFQTGAKERWFWTAMIMQPPEADDDAIARAMAEVERKKKLDLAGLRLEVFDEGLCAQVLHIGPFAEEGPTIARLHRFIGERGALRGKHHEIYLSDIRRAAPSAWKTVVRQPMTTS